jgi:glycosyltransferase involved in cell wall biosynthesis
MIPTYNCSAFLAKTIESVLAQDPGPEKMQIEVVDDNSTDMDVEALVRRLGKGRIGFYRQPANVGSLRNFETCLNRARGQWIHLLHGDDMVRPGFYKEVETLFNTYPEAGAACTAYTEIDQLGKIINRSQLLAPEPGILKNWLSRIAKAQRVQPAAIVVKRSVYERLGSFFAVQYGEDWEMWVRIAAHYPVAYSPRRLACYRIHDMNISSQSLLSGQSVRDLHQVIALISQHLPQGQRKKHQKLAKKHASKYFAVASDKVYHELHDPEKALALSKSAFRMDRNPVTFFYLVKTRAKIFFHYKYSYFPPETGKENSSHRHFIFPMIVPLHRRTRKKNEESQ